MLKSLASPRVAGRAACWPHRSPVPSLTMAARLAAAICASKFFFICQTGLAGKGSTSRMVRVCPDCVDMVRTKPAATRSFAPSGRLKFGKDLFY